MKKAKAFMINEDIYKEFQKLAKEKGLILSVLIENYMKQFIKENNSKQ